VATRAIVMQHKTRRAVQFEITQATRNALQAWIIQNWPPYLPQCAPAAFACQ